MDQMKEKFMDIATKPVKKVAEARARKRRQTLKKVKAAKKKANDIANLPDMSTREKLKAIDKAMKTAKTKKESKLYVISRRGRSAANTKGHKKGDKGAVKVVDPRMKSDKRNAEKREKRKGGGKRKNDMCYCVELLTVDWSRPLTMVEQEDQLEMCRETQRKLYKQKKAKLAAQAAAEDRLVTHTRTCHRELLSHRPQARIVPVVMELDSPPLDDTQLHSSIPRSEAELHALTLSLHARQRIRTMKLRSLSPPPLSEQLPPATPPTVRVCTVPPAVVLELDKTSLPKVTDPPRWGPMLDDADIYAHETHYSNNLPMRVKKGLSFQTTPPLRPIERDQAQKALAHKSKTRRRLELQQLEQALRMRETRKVDIERQMRLVRSLATLRQPLDAITIPQINVSVPSMSTLTLSIEKRPSGSATTIARSELIQRAGSLTLDPVAMAAAEEHLDVEESTAALSALLALEDNEHCADCQALHPKWAIITHGGFICTQCAGVHRSLGVHISFVLSCTLDKWTPLQLAALVAGGNTKLNERLEFSVPESFRKPHADALREDRAAYIHTKYVDQAFRMGPNKRRQEAILASPSTPLEVAVSSHGSCGMVEYVGIVTIELVEGSTLAAMDVNG
ncbi:hypothetical protein DYB28_010150, partial [Aphanomyces astaci]